MNKDSESSESEESSEGISLPEISDDEAIPKNFIEEKNLKEENLVPSVVAGSFTYYVTKDASVLTHGDILLNIFDYMKAEEIAKCGRVNKFFHQTSQNQRLWTTPRGKLHFSFHFGKFSEEKQ